MNAIKNLLRRLRKWISQKELEYVIRTFPKLDPVDQEKIAQLAERMAEKNLRRGR